MGDLYLSFVYFGTSVKGCGNDFSSKIILAIKISNLSFTLRYSCNYLLKSQKEILLKDANFLSFLSISKDFSIGIVQSFIQCVNESTSNLISIDMN